MWDVEDYIKDDENCVTNKVYSIVDKASTEKDRDAAGLERNIYTLSSTGSPT